MRLFDERAWKALCLLIRDCQLAERLRHGSDGPQGAGWSGAEVTDIDRARRADRGGAVICMMAVAFAYKYQASNTSATYAPDWSPPTKIGRQSPLDCARHHHRHPGGDHPGKPPLSLGPYRARWNPDVRTVRVVSSPRLEVAVSSIGAGDRLRPTSWPSGRHPVNFRVTSDTVMNSCFIPSWASRIYAMAGMQTKLHHGANGQRAGTGHLRAVAAVPFSPA